MVEGKSSADSGTLRYPAIAYRQALNSDAPLMVTFVTTAEELVSWAGVPRRGEGGGTGFQRALDGKRQAAVTEFFKLPDNQSPTAVIVGVPEAPPGLAPRIQVEGWSDSGGPIQVVELSVRVPDRETPIQEVVETLRMTLKARVEDDTTEADEEDESATDDLDTEVVEVEQEVGPVEGEVFTQPTEALLDEQEDSDGEEVALEFSKSELRRMLDLLDDPTWVLEVAGDLRDLAKPAVIIDGQHRVYGAKDLERNIPFAACALVGVSWAEEVFQFTVVNRSSTRLSDQFIAGNAAISLTSKELGGLIERLDQAGIETEEFQVMDTLQWKDSSPFHMLIAVGEKKNANLLGYKTMVRMAKEWRFAKPHGLSKLLENLYPDLRRKMDRLQRWKDSGDWQAFFWKFWASVKDEYEKVPSDKEGQFLWTTALDGSNLMTAIVLYRFQAAFLTFFALKVGKPKDGEDLREFYLGSLEENARYFCGLQAKLLAAPWKEKSLNSTQGRKYLDDSFTLAWQNDGTYSPKRSKLVTGSSG